MKKSLLFLASIFLPIFLNAQEEIAEDVICIYFKSKSKVAGELCDAFSKLKEFYEYKEYADGYADDIKNEREPRNPPTNLNGGNLLIDKLNKTESDVKSILIPNSISINSIVFPEINSLTSDNLAIRRQALENAIDYVIEYNKSVEDFDFLKLDLENFRNEADAVNKSLNILKKELWELFENTGSGFTELSNVFGFAALDIETKLGPVTAHIRNELNDKIRQLTNLIEIEKTKINNIQSNVNIFLIAEKELLDKNLQELNERQLQIERKNAELEVKGKENERRGDELRNIEKNLIEYQKELIKIQKEIERKVDNYNSEVDKLRDMEKRINSMKYTGCPNNESYNNCSHTAKKNEYVKKRNEAVEDYNKTARMLENKAKELNSAQASFASKAEDFNKKQSEFEVNAEKWKKEYDEIVLMVQDISKRAAELFLQRFDNQNKLEQNQIDANRLSIMKNIAPN